MKSKDGIDTSFVPPIR